MVSNLKSLLHIAYLPGGQSGRFSLLLETKRRPLALGHCCSLCPLSLTLSCPEVLPWQQDCHWPVAKNKSSTSQHQNVSSRKSTLKVSSRSRPGAPMPPSFPQPPASDSIGLQEGGDCALAEKQPPSMFQE